jgi:hypothetical protein
VSTLYLGGLYTRRRLWNATAAPRLFRPKVPRERLGVESQDYLPTQRRCFTSSSVRESFYGEAWRMQVRSKYHPRGSEGGAQGHQRFGRRRNHTTSNNGARPRSNPQGETQSAHARVGRTRRPCDRCCRILRTCVFAYGSAAGPAGRGAAQLGPTSAPFSVRWPSWSKLLSGSAYDWHLTPGTCTRSYTLIHLQEPYFTSNTLNLNWCHARQPSVRARLGVTVHPSQLPSSISQPSMMELSSSPC